MQYGLVMEGGAMRGMFTAGVIDVFLEENITFDGAIGVSAGAVFGCNFKSQQKGRVIRYNKRFCHDRRYVSWRGWLKTGDLYSVEFAYHEVPERLDLFDRAAFSANPMQFFVVATDNNSGEAVYHRCSDGLARDLEYMRASASLPLLAKPVLVDGLELSDGGTADSIPLRFMQSQGYARNVLILTQPPNFVKKPNRLYPLMKPALKAKPKLLQAIKTRHERYNQTLAYIKECEQAGSVLVIQPQETLAIGKVEKNPAELERVYQLGRQAAREKLGAVREFFHQG